MYPLNKHIVFLLQSRCSDNRRTPAVACAPVSRISSLLELITFTLFKSVIWHTSILPFPPSLPSLHFLPRTGAIGEGNCTRLTVFFEIVTTQGSGGTQMWFLHLQTADHRVGKCLGGRGISRSVSCPVVRFISPLNIIIILRYSIRPLHVNGPLSGKVQELFANI